MPTVGGVDEPARGVDDDLGRREAGAVGDVRRECRHGLERRERAGLGVVGQDGDGEIELIDRVADAAVGMEREVSWTGARGQHGGRVRGERAARGVERVHEHLVEAEVADDREPAVG